MRKFYKFRKGAKEAKPSFSYKDESGDIGENIYNVKGIVSGVYYNQPKEINTQDKWLVTIPADVTVKFEDNNSVAIPSTAGHLYRTAINSLLAVEKWDSLEFGTFVNNKWYKSISLTNPDKKVKKNIWGKELELNELYYGVVPFAEIPKVETTEFWGKTLFDDTKANTFLIEKLKAKFSNNSDNTDGVTVESNSSDIDLSDIPF